MPKAVLFDLDGTLIYSSKAIRASISQTLVEFGHEALNEENVKHFVGVPLAQALSHWTDDPKPMMDRYREIYMACFEEMSYVYEGVPEMLEAIQGITTGIITLKGNPQARHVMDTMGIGKYFRHIYGDDGPGKARYPIKPNPKHFYFAMYDLGLITEGQYEELQSIEDLTGMEPPFDHANILFIGDTESDMRGAISAGIHPVGVSWGLRTKEQLSGAGAEHIVENPAGLVQLLGELGFL